jgi:predicted ArsR family transcriptional regulator
MQATRQKIIQLLRRRSGLTTGDLSDMLKISATAVRRHLSTLEAQGTVFHRVEQRGMGRPSYVYRLADGTPEVFPQSYTAFAASVVQKLAELDGGKTAEELINALQEKRQRQYITKTRGETLSDRVACLAQLMEKEGRMNTWQRLDDEQFVLREHNCPFHRLNGSSEFFCRGELALLRKTLQAEVKRVSHILEGDVACAFVIQGRSNGRHMAVNQPRYALPDTLAA